MEDMHLELKPGKINDYEYTEAVKTLRTNIQFCGSSVRVIMFTSAIPSEGKSDLSFATAEALAQIGKRTLLIDADIRKSILTYRYQLKNKLNGLSQFLSGQKRLEEVLYTTSTRGLDLIFAGPFSPNPAELLEEELFGDTVKKLREAYDYIIIDTPPMAGLIDGAIVARHCDGAVLIIESGAVSWRVEQKVVEQLKRSQCRILGAVLNKADSGNGGYYGRYGKYRKYGKYGKYGRYENAEHEESSYSRLEPAKHTAARPRTEIPNSVIEPDMDEEYKELECPSAAPEHGESQ